MPSVQLAVGPEPDLAGPAWGAAADANTALAWSSSPAAFVQNLTAPVLLIHGDADDSVYFQVPVPSLYLPCTFPVPSATRTTPSTSRSPEALL